MTVNLKKSLPNKQSTEDLAVLENESCNKRTFSDAAEFRNLVLARKNDGSSNNSSDDENSDLSEHITPGI